MASTKGCGPGSLACPKDSYGAGGSVAFVLNFCFFSREKKATAAAVEKIGKPRISLVQFDRDSVVP